MAASNLATSTGLPKWLFEFGLDTIQRFNIDWSHGMDHALAVLHYARDIVAGYQRDHPKIQLIPRHTNPEAKRLIDVAALVHDWIDHKYMREDVGIARLEQVFQEHNFPYTASVVAIITSISFSKRVTRKKQGLPMLDLGELQLAAEIVADADMLDAYNPERCLVYQNRFANDPEEYRRIVRAILVDRVLQYRDHYLNTPYARAIAKPLHDQLAAYVKSKGLEK
jgi:HD superfamily phosphodiesterase